MLSIYHSTKRNVPQTPIRPIRQLRPRLASGVLLLGPKAGVLSLQLGATVDVYSYVYVYVHTSTFAFTVTVTYAG